MIKTIVTLFFLVLIQISSAQDYELGKVSIAELAEKSYAKDSSANAVILYKNQKTYFTMYNSSVNLVTEVYKRIKIYNKEGFDKANIEVNLYKSRSEKERIVKIKAFTYNLEGSKIIKTELEKDQIFKNEYSYNYNQVKFTLPNVKEGSVLEIKYKIISPFYYNIDEFKFQYDIPVKKLEAEIRTPNGFNFSPKSKGHIVFYPNRSLKRDNRLGMEVDILNYTLNDVPALKEESYVNNIENYRAGVFFELVSVEIPGRRNEYYAKTWADVAKKIGNTEDYENQLDKTNSFDDNVDNIIAGQSSQIDKMESIFKYIKDNIKWNGLDGKYFSNGIRKALKEKKGNAADVNLSLVAMLRYAGIKANPVIISTKENLIPFFPTLDRLNYVIAYAVIDEKEYFLDATDEFSAINLLPLKDYNWRGILVDNTQMQWKLIDIKEPKTGLVQYMVNMNLNSNGEIEGKTNSRYKNHNAYAFRQNFKDRDLDDFIAQREEVLNNIEISNYKVTNGDSYEGFVSESFEFYKDEAVDILDNKIYIQPMFFLRLEENPFKSEKREFPIDYGHPFKSNYIINITIPEGYTVESSPQSLNMKIPDNLGQFIFNISAYDNKIQLSVSLEIKKTVIGTNKYEFLKQFYNQIIKKQAEQVVLVKS